MNRTLAIFLLVGVVLLAAACGDETDDGETGGFIDGIGFPQIQVTEPGGTLEFDYRKPGGTTRKPLQIFNMGNGPLVIHSMSLENGGVFSVADGGIPELQDGGRRRVEPGESVDVGINYHGGHMSSRDTYLTFETNDAGTSCRGYVVPLRVLPPDE